MVANNLHSGNMPIQIKVAIIATFFMIWDDEAKGGVGVMTATDKRSIPESAANRKRAGRKPIGITRKLSLTLPQSCWDEIDRQCARGDYSVSEVIRCIVDDYLQGADLN